MIEDILYTIMLVCNTKVLTSMFQINKYTHRWCTSPYFWNNRFNKHKLVMYRQPSPHLTCRDYITEFIRTDYAHHKMKSLLKHGLRHARLPKYKLVDQITLIANEPQTLIILNHLVKTQHFDKINHLTDSFIYFNLHGPRASILIYLFAEHITLDEFTLFYMQDEIVDVLAYIIYAVPDVIIKSGCGYNMK